MLKYTDVKVLPTAFLLKINRSIRAFLIVQLVKNLPARQKTLVRIPGSGISTGEGIGYPLQFSGLENSLD